MANLTRLTNGQRRGLQVGGIVLFVTGLLIFVSVPMRMFGDLDAGLNPASFFGTALVGMLLFAVGGQMARFGFMKPVSELVATETGGALEHAGERAGSGLGRGFARSGMVAGGGASREVIKVKCRSCGYLETEDARFCSGCGQPV